MRTPICFVSYSWDSDAHKDWVRNLASTLVSNGVDTHLDQWDVQPGIDLTTYMETCVRKSDFVLLICTPTFAQKANSGKGGVGYEKAIVTGEIFQGSASPKKFVPILRSGDARDALPAYLASRAYVDFRDDAKFQDKMEELLRNFYESPLYPRPSLGQRPKFTSPPAVRRDPVVKTSNRTIVSPPAGQQAPVVKTYQPPVINPPVASKNWLVVLGVVLTLAIFLGIVALSMLFALPDKSVLPEMIGPNLATPSVVQINVVRERSVTPAATATSAQTGPPLITAFNANQTSVQAGTSVLLTWSVSNADFVFLDLDKVDPVGSRFVAPTGTTTYHLIANNVGGTTDRTITITVQSLPDLTVTDIGVSPIGQVTYTIRNIGSGDVTRMFLIEVLVDGIPVDSNRRVSSLSAGQDVSLFVPNYTLSGLHTVTVRVNGDHQIQEANTNNGEFTRTLNGVPIPPTNTPVLPTPVPSATPIIIKPASTPMPTYPPTFTPTYTPTSTPTRTPTPTATIVVTSASASLTSTSPYMGTCPGIASYSATIRTSSPVTIRYQWERSDGIVNGPYNVPVGTTPLTVADQWLSPPLGTSWERVHVLQPSDLASNQVFFTNNCH